MVLEYNAMQAGLLPVPLSLSKSGGLRAGKRASKRRPGHLLPPGFALLTASSVALILIIPGQDPAGVLRCH